MANDPSFPWEAFLEASRQKAQNQQNFYQNIAGIGQGLGTGIGAVGQALQERKQRALINAAIDKLLSQNQPPQTSTATLPTSGFASPPMSTGQPIPPMTMIPKQPMPMPPAPPTTPPQSPMPSTVDPIMQAILPLVKADQSLLPSVLPAIARGAYQRQRPGKTGGSDYQWANLSRMMSNDAEHKKEFAQRQRDIENYQNTRTNLMAIADSLHAKGLSLQEKRIRATIADLDAKHNILYGLGFEQSPSEAAGFDTDTSGGGISDDGWSDVTASP